MDIRPFTAAGALLLALPCAVAAGGAFSSLHPEEAHPDPQGAVTSHPYTGFISRVQEKLRLLGFDAGPVNGDFGTKTQAALAQFQLSAAIPASGQLDDRTLGELGLERDEQAAAGASGDQTTLE